MDAGPIIGAAGHPTGPRREAAPGAASAAVTGQLDPPLSSVPTRAGEGLATATRAAAAARTPADRRKLVIRAAVVAVILIVVIVVLVVAHPFSVYRS